MRIDRQILYFVFLAGSVAHAAPAPIPTTQSSLDIAPDLTFDISPQDLSSAFDFASQVISAVFAENTNTLRTVNTTRSTGTGEKYNEASTSYPLSIASQTSDPRWSRTRQSILASQTEQSTYTHLRSTTSEGYLNSPSHSTGYTDSSHEASAQATVTRITGLPTSHDRSRSNSTFSRHSINVNMTTLATGDLQQPTTTNALSVLFSALPTSLIAPIQSEYSDLFDPVESGISSLTDDIFGSPTRTRSGIRTRTRPTASPSSITTSSTTTSPSTTAPTDPPTTTDTNARPTYATSVDSDAADATSTEAPEAEERPERSEHAATIGIATGAASGGVLAILAGVFLWRRRQQGKSPFAGRGGNGGKGVYPEVAWLYDPNITPPRSRAGSGSGQQLIPEPRPGSVEIGGTPIMGGHSPEMRGVSSPLLAPVVAASRDMTGGGRRSRSGSDVNMLRPLTAIGEEATPRGSMS